MKIFSKTPRIYQQGKILHALKELFLKKFPQTGAPLYQEDRQDQFILKMADKILWGKIYFNVFEKHHLELVKLEQECVKQTFGLPVETVIFFPNTALSQQQLLDFPQAIFYHYMLAESGIEEAILLEPVWGADKLAAPEIASAGAGAGGHHGALTHEEIHDLIEISLELGQV